MFGSLADGSRRSTARVGGLLYLVVAVTGGFSMFYFTWSVYVPGDPAATVDNIRASETLFRLGIASGLVSHATFVVLALSFYKLFKDVSRSFASALVAWSW